MLHIYCYSIQNLKIYHHGPTIRFSSQWISWNLAIGYHWISPFREHFRLPLFLIYKRYYFWFHGFLEGFFTSSSWIVESRKTILFFWCSLFILYSFCLCFLYKKRKEKGCFFLKTWRNEILSSLNLKILEIFIFHFSHRPNNYYLFLQNHRMWRAASEFEVWFSPSNDRLKSEEWCKSKS